MKKTKILILTAGLLFGMQEVSGQSIRMEQDVNQDTVLSDYGRNRKNFFGTYLGIGAFADQINHDSVQVKPFQSTRFEFGVYYKRKISKAYSLLLSASFLEKVYRYEVPEDIKYRRLHTQELGLELVNRFNYGRRGNYLGNYVEVGASTGYIYSNKAETKQTIDNDQLNYKTRVITFKGLKYIEPMNYYAHLRFGFNKFVITANYRLSDLFDQSVDYQLPAMSIGARIDLGGN